MITKNKIASMIFVSGVVLSGILSAYADVTIDGQVYTDAWIAAHPTEVADYIKNNGQTAATILNSASASTQNAVLNAYNQVTGSQMTIDQGRQWAATNAQNAPVVVVNGQAYTDAWIRVHQADVAAFIQANPSQAVTVLQNASASTVQAVVTSDWVKKNSDAVLGFIKNSPSQAATILKNVDATTATTIINAYNAKNPNAQITQAQANAWIAQNGGGANMITQAWLANHPGYKSAFDGASKINEGQIKEWLAENPNLTAKQIADTLVMYNVNLTQLSRATGKDVQELIKIADQSGLTREVLAQKGILSPMSAADVRNNVWWAVMVGALPKGVFYALQKIDQGDSYDLPDHHDPAAAFSQADMDLAKKLSANGYWGPTGSGDVSTELAKAGCLNGFVYNEKKCGNAWTGGTSAQSTGPNIFKPATSTPTTSSSSLSCPMYQQAAPCASGYVSVPQGKDSSGCNLPAMCVPSSSAYATTTLANEDTSVVDNSCTDLTYYMSISLTRSPSASSYTRKQSTDTLTEGEVSDLQSFLKDNGYMDQSVTTTGRYGSMTTRAVKSLQAKYGFTQTGATGPLTRNKIKELSGCNSSTVSTNAPIPQKPQLSIAKTTFTKSEAVNGAIVFTWASNGGNNCYIDRFIAGPYDYVYMPSTTGTTVRGVSFPTATTFAPYINIDIITPYEHSYKVGCTYQDGTVKFSDKITTTIIAG